MVVTIFSALIACIAQAQYTVEILHYARWPQSGCFGAGAGQQVGWAGNYFFRAILWRGGGEPHVGARSTTSSLRATMWSSSRESWVDLHPLAYPLSWANGISGNVQVGYGNPNPQGPGYTHALLWRGTASSVTVLHPPGADSSEAYATDGTQHVGYVSSSQQQEHAALWEGPTQRFVDLNPPGYHLSIAMGVAKGQQVGLAAFHGSGHAALWRGTRESFVDLNPAPSEYNGSRANATNGAVQVGRAAVSGPPWGLQYVAAAWRGTRQSHLNLHQFLPKDYQGYLVGAESEARGIDADGVIVGWARHLPTNTHHAVVWRPIRR